MRHKNTRAGPILLFCDTGHTAARCIVRNVGDCRSLPLPAGLLFALMLQKKAEPLKDNLMLEG